MSLVVVGLNHRTVPIGLLERMAVAPEGLPKALQSLGGAEHLAEVVLLSTCNRTEIYAHATLFHPAIPHYLRLNAPAAEQASIAVFRPGLRFRGRHGCCRSLPGRSSRS